MHAERRDLVAPPQADHAAERLARAVAVARGVLERDAIPAAVLERDARAALRALEAHLDLGHEARLEVVAAPFEDQAIAGLPRQHAAHLERAARLVGVDLEQPAALAALEAHHARPAAAVPEARAAPPPQVDLAGEERERGARIGRTRRSSPARSRWSCGSSSRPLRIRPCAAPRARRRTRADRSRTTPARAARARARRRARAGAGRAARARRRPRVPPPRGRRVRSTRRWRLIAGALAPNASASSPARRGRSRSSSTTRRRVGSASADSVRSSCRAALPPRRRHRGALRSGEAKIQRWPSGSIAR